MAPDAPPSARDCDICRCLLDHETVEKFGEDDDAGEGPAFARRVEAIRKLTGDFHPFPNPPVKRCPSCGTFYFYDLSYSPWYATLDHLFLSLDRFTEEQTRVLGPLLISEDEVVILRALEEAFPHDEKEEIAEKAELIFREMLHAKLVLRDKEREVALLEKLLAHRNDRARRMAAEFIIGLKDDVEIAPGVLKACEEILGPP